MEKEHKALQPKGRCFGKEAARRQDAISWNADVERRRREYHERRCAEDPVYWRAYCRQQEMMQRVQKMNSVAMAQLQNAMGEAEDTKCRQATDQTAVAGHPQRVKTHEEVMRERAMLPGQHKNTENCPGGNLLTTGMLAIMFAVPAAAERRIKEMEEERPYIEEIRRADREFDEELIRMSGFEW